MALYGSIKEDIINGRYKKGDRLTSKRDLAQQLGVSVVTVEHAYHLLEDDGYVVSRQRSGFYVRPADSPDQRGAQRRLLPVVDFKSGFAQYDDFPFNSLSKVMRTVLSHYGESILEKPPNRGCAVLRNALSEYLLRRRGMAVDPERIIVGSGAEYLYMLTVLLLGKDKIYGVEDPSYEKIRLVYAACGAKYELLPMDSCGVCSDALQNTKADVLHVTPFHSFPSGITAPASKRFEYLTWASRAGGIIIEDDYASEFSSGSKPVETVFSMDRNDCVIYMNTFSKSLAPSMRMGYMILPEHLTQSYDSRFGFLSCTVPAFDQYVLAEFISGGYFERHINRRRRRQAGRRK